MDIASNQGPAIRQRAFDRDRFVEDCVSAHRADGMDAVAEVLAEELKDHRAVLRALGGPTRAGLDVMHSSPDFTIFAAHWTPQMNLLPHDHMMKALIGIYTGREDNILWRRGDDGIEAYEANCLFEGDVAALPANAIHSVTNPLQRFTGGIHIYDGDFFETERHQWNPETLAEEPSDGDAIKAMFAQENQRFFAQRGI
ncbi:hypothetical protein [Parerythrobacter aestuarii]|uniref:hypothetical protein n=1 Tax=Parerythrobacter aestuarii TaxID=3020909 RepID=UPI0024DEA98D|nr:hypothetical protein [Parerythrobacter aestuarii]